MKKSERSVFDRLEDIENSQSTTQMQNEKIINMLNGLNKRQLEKLSIDGQFFSYVDEQKMFRIFMKNAKKEHIWFGTSSEFKKAKSLVNGVAIALIIVGFVSSLISIVAFEIVSTFTLLEDIWLIVACIMYGHAIKAKKKMWDLELKDNCNTKFVRDENGTWRNTDKVKKIYVCTRNIAYVSVFANIICAWYMLTNGVALTVTILELAFFVLSIIFNIVYSNLFEMYGFYILYTGRNASNTKYVTLIYDTILKRVASYEEYKAKYNDYL